MSNRKMAKSAAGKVSAPSKAAMHVPLPAVLVGLGLLSAAGVGHAAAVNDHYSVVAGTTLSGVNVTDNDSLSPNSSVQVIEIVGPSHGNALLASDGELTYTPNPSYRGNDSLYYALNNAGTSFANVFITVSDPVPVPGLTPAGIAALSAGIAGLALRRRRRKS